MRERRHWQRELGAVEDGDVGHIYPDITKYFVVVYTQSILNLVLEYSAYHKSSVQHMRAARIVTTAAD